MSVFYFVGGCNIRNPFYFDLFVFSPIKKRVGANFININEIAKDTADDITKFRIPCR